MSTSGTGTTNEYRPTCTPYDHPASTAARCSGSSRPGQSCDPTTDVRSPCTAGTAGRPPPPGTHRCTCGHTACTHVHGDVPPASLGQLPKSQPRTVVPALGGSPEPGPRCTRRRTTWSGSNSPVSSSVSTCEPIRARGPAPVAMDTASNASILFSDAKIASSVSTTRSIPKGVGCTRTTHHRCSGSTGIPSTSWQAGKRTLPPRRARRSS